MIPIYLIDDEQDRHETFDRMCVLINAACPEVFTAPQLVGPTLPNTAARAAFSTNYDFVTSLCSKTDAQAIILLDLKHESTSSAEETNRSQNQAVWLRAVGKHNVDLATSLTSTLAQASVFPSFFRPHYTATLAAAIARAKNWPVLLISSNATAGAAAEFIELFKCHVPPRMGNVALEQVWKEGVLQILPHKDPLVSRALHLYQSQATGGVTLPWSHRGCQETAQRDTAKQFLRGEGEVGAAQTKALFMHSDSAPAFEWIRQRYTLSKATLASALVALGIDATIEADYFQLPCNPGLAFLISLRELAADICGTHGRDSSKIRFEVLTDEHAQGLAYAVIIALTRQMDKHELNHFTEFVEKVVSGQLSEMNVPKSGSFSLRIWNVCHARAEGLHVHATHSLYSMFRNGTPGFIAWPCFESDRLVLRWRAYEAKT